MKFGYFDNDRREYVIDNPDTPAPWVNYLGSPEYGAIISNNAGGYSFAKSGANGRILRYIFNHFDQGAISTYVIMKARITGLLLGSRLGRNSQNIRVSAAMGLRIQKSRQITAASLPRHCTMSRWIRSMRYGN